MRSRNPQSRDPTGDDQTLPPLALQDAAPAVVPADTAWMLVSTALVLLMTPALAFFYGGLVRSKNSLNTMMMSFVALGAVGIVWALAAYSLAFSEGNAWIGGTTNLVLGGVGTEAKGTIPHLLFMAYQGTFAIITAALISGAVVERMRFGPYVAFIVFWTLLVYAPVAHWVWGGGWLMTRGVLDFAGGTVVHINAGVSALVAAHRAWRLERTTAVRPCCPITCRSCCSARACSGSAGSASTAGARWRPTSWPRWRSPTRSWLPWPRWWCGCCSTTSEPAAPPPSAGQPASWSVSSPSLRPPGFVSPVGALLLGGIAAFPSYFAILYRSRTRLDDSLDVFAGHGIGGMTGALLTGVFAQKAWNAAGADGLLAGNAAQLGIQALGVATSLIYAGAMTFVILKVLGWVTVLRAAPKTEGVGMDVSQHGEEAYTNGEGSILVLPDVVAAGSPVAAFNPQPASR